MKQFAVLVFLKRLLKGDFGVKGPVALLSVVIALGLQYFGIINSEGVLSVCQAAFGGAV